jgi:beta-phosphoglucomutase-like phosphatase (HAD superfamily)
MMARAAAFERELEAVVGAADAVRGVQRLGCETCVASQGEIEKMQQTLRVTELASCFAPERIFSATMVANGKPAPDLYLHAADACGFSVADCLVVEDSVTGVTAARAAGMRVLGFVAEPMRDAEPAQRMAALGAELFHDMREVPARVAG